MICFLVGTDRRIVCLQVSTEGQIETHALHCWLCSAVVVEAETVCV